VEIQASGDLGSRRSKGATWDKFARAVPSGSVQIVIRERLTIGGTESLYIVHGDKSVLPDGTYGAGAVTVDYRFYIPPKKGPSAGLSIKYVRGRDEPAFKKMNALTAGVSLHR
jgi:hypothetical protein